MFYHLKLIEAYGTGLPKIIKAYARSGLEPKFEVTSNAFRITLPNRNASAKEENMPDRPKSNEERILTFAELHGYIVRSDVDTLLGVSQATANRILKRMVADGLLYQDGSGRRTRYIKK